MKRLRVRHRLSVIYFIIGIWISLFSLFTVLGIYNAYLAQIEGKQKANYVSQVELNIWGIREERLKELPELEQQIGLQANMKIPDVLLRSNNCIYSWYTDIVVSSRIPEHVWLPDGSRFSFPAAAENQKRLVAAGCNRTSFARQENGECYLDLQDCTPFLVYEEIGMPDSDYQDGYVMLRFADIPDTWYPMLLEEGLNVRIQSDSFLSDEEVNQAVSVIYENWPEAVVSAQRVDHVQTGTVYLRVRSLSMPVWIYLFCTLILAHTSVFWVKERTREIMIRKIFGNSNLQIWFIMIRELVFWFVAAFVLYIPIQKSAALILSGAAVSIRMEAEDGLILAVYLLVTFLVCTVGPFFAVKRMSPAEAMNQWGGTL